MFITLTTLVNKILLTLILYTIPSKTKAAMPTIAKSLIKSIILIIITFILISTLEYKSSRSIDISIRKIEDSTLRPRA